MKGQNFLFFYPRERTFSEDDEDGTLGPYLPPPDSAGIGFDLVSESVDLFWRVFSNFLESGLKVIASSWV